MYKNKKQEKGAVKNQKNFLSNRGLKRGTLSLASTCEVKDCTIYKKAL